MTEPIKRGRGRPRKDGQPNKSNVQMKERSRGKILFEFNSEIIRSNDLELRDTDGKPICLIVWERGS